MYFLDLTATRHSLALGTSCKTSALGTRYNLAPAGEEIAGMFSIVHGETLRFILSAHIPLERFIRYELACRGYDKDFLWVGFDKAENIWLK